MGYFSKLNLGIQENDIDRSYPSFEDQLLWRYEDLKNRYMELIEVAVPAARDDYFNSDDYRYAPVECFKTLSDVYRAIEIAKSDLERKCGIIVRDDGSIETIDDDEDLDQITVYEIVLLPTWFQTAVAA
jgi:hypothetical protein